MTTGEFVENLKASIAAMPGVLEVGSVDAAPFTIGVSAEEDNYTVTVERIGLFDLRITDRNGPSRQAGIDHSETN